MEKILPGLYQHYKGGKYQVIGEALFSEDPDQEFVVYKALYECTIRSSGKKLPFGSLWIRPKKMFLEKVLVDGQEIDRFKKIEE